MNWLSVDDVYLIHHEIIARAGSNASVRDFSLLHSAVERLKATYAGKDLYPTIFSKAAALLHSLCMNHPFTDGSKRTSWASTHKFLWINRYHLRATKENVVSFMLNVSKDELALKEISSWLKSHSQTRQIPPLAL